jgi:hypothetical protein
MTSFIGGIVAYAGEKVKWNRPDATQVWLGRRASGLYLLDPLTACPRSEAEGVPVVSERGRSAAADAGQPVLDVPLRG